MSVLAAVLSAPIIAFPIMWAVDNPLLWLLMPVAMVMAFFVHYAVFRVSEERQDSTDKGRSRPT